MTALMFAKLAPLAQALSLMLATSPSDRIMQAVGLDPNLYHAELVTALVEVESCGKSDVVKGKFVGPLQLGPTYIKEAQGTRAQAMTYEGSLLLWSRVQRRYRVRRPGEPPLVLGIFHKGGPGTLKTTRRLLRKMPKPHTLASWRKAAIAAARLHKIPNMSAFLERYESALRGQTFWCGPKTTKKTS